MKLKGGPRSCFRLKETERHDRSSNERSGLDPLAAKEIIGVVGKIFRGLLGERVCVLYTVQAVCL